MSSASSSALLEPKTQFSMSDVKLLECATSYTLYQPWVNVTLFHCPLVHFNSFRHLRSKQNRPLAFFTCLPAEKFFHHLNEKFILPFKSRLFRKLWKTFHTGSLIRFPAGRGAWELNWLRAGLWQHKLLMYYFRI